MQFAGARECIGPSLGSDDKAVWLTARLTMSERALTELLRGKGAHAGAQALVHVGAQAFVQMNAAKITASLDMRTVQTQFFPA